MEKATFKAELRDIAENVKELRQGMIIPAVVYGKGEEAVTVKVPTTAFTKFLKEVGYSTVIDLDINGTVKKVLVQEVQYDSMYDVITHVDFYIVDMNKKVTAHVPVELIGQSASVMEGNVLSQVMHEIEVSCLPDDLIQHIELDIEVLAEVGDAIYVKDIKISDKVEILTDGEQMVVNTAEPKEEVEEEVEEVATEEGAEGEGAEGDTPTEEKSE